MDTQPNVEACFIPMTEPNPLRRSNFDIPEARDLTWRDSFFDNKNDEFVAVFDRDFVGAGAYGAFFTTCWYAFIFLSGVGFWVFTESPESYATIGTVLLVVFALLVPGAVFCRESEGQVHLAVTTKGIRYDFKYGNEFVSRTVAFEDFDECVVFDTSMVSLFCCIRGHSVKRIALTGIRWDYCCDSLCFYSTRLYDMRYSDIWDPIWDRRWPYKYYPLVGLERAEEFVNLVMAMKQRKKQAPATENLSIV